MSFRAATISAPLQKETQKCMESVPEGRLARNPPHPAMQLPHPIRIEVPLPWLAFHTDSYSRAVVRHDTPIKVIWAIRSATPLSDGIVIIMPSSRIVRTVCQWKLKLKLFQLVREISCANWEMLKEPA